jgi:hypothetical protein
MAREGQDVILIDLEGPVLIRVGQGGMLGELGRTRDGPVCPCWLGVFPRLHGGLGPGGVGRRGWPGTVPSSEERGGALALVVTEDLFKDRPGNLLE